MTSSAIPPSITEGPLAPEAIGHVLALAEAAQAADGVAPLSEDGLLQVRYGSDPGARDLLLTAPDGSVAGYAHLGAPDAEPAGEDQAADADLSGELVVHPAYRRLGYGTRLASAIGAGAQGHGIRLWAHGDLAGAAGLAKSAGFTRVRSLWQMRMDLTAAELPEPVYPAGTTVRPFRPGSDEDAWLAVNSRAFAHHPEQGAWTRADLELREAEPWFDPAGFFLAERDGTLAGFHWTKVHPPEGPGGPAIGEVYVVGIDPAAQGGGLGRALTLSGLRHLRDAGLGLAMLYVDESNAAAVRLYTALGFSRWSVDVMYRRASLLTGEQRVLADAENRVELGRRERSITGRDRGEYLRVELDLVECHVVVNT